MFQNEKLNELIAAMPATPQKLPLTMLFVLLDINPNKEYGSSCVINEAVGYIRGMCNIVPLVKPNAWAASYCADRYKDAIQHINHKKDVA